MREWWSKIRAMLVGRRGVSDGLAEELDAHLELEIQECLAFGMSLEEARETARRRFGNMTLIHEDANQAWAFPSFENCVRDLAYACRNAAKESWIRNRSHPDAGAWNWRKHDDVHRDPRGVAEALGISRAGPPGADFGGHSPAKSS